MVTVWCRAPQAVDAQTIKITWDATLQLSLEDDGTVGDQSGASHHSRAALKWGRAEGQQCGDGHPECPASQTCVHESQYYAQCVDCNATVRGQRRVQPGGVACQHVEP